MKIYEDKSEIYAAIRSANRKLKELREEIAAEDIKRKEAFGPVRGAIEDKIIKLEAKAGRIESVRLVKLKIPLLPTILILSTSWMDTKVWRLKNYETK